MSQPIERAVYHVLMTIVRTVQKVVQDKAGAKGGNKGHKEEIADNVTFTEVNIFRRGKGWRGFMAGN